jgi:hypothetical protein
VRARWLNLWYKPQRTQQGRACQEPDGAAHRSPLVLQETSRRQTRSSLQNFTIFMCHLHSNTTQRAWSSLTVDAGDLVVSSPMRHMACRRAVPRSRPVRASGWSCAAHSVMSLVIRCHLSTRGQGRTWRRKACGEHPELEDRHRSSSGLNPPGRSPQGDRQGHTLVPSCHRVDAPLGRAKSRANRLFIRQVRRDST